MPDTAARDDALAPRRPASPPAGRRDPLRRWRIAGLALPFAALALLEVVVRQGWLPNHLVPAPSEILDTLARLGITRVARHVGASTLRVAAGFAAGAGLALVVGAAMGLSRRIDALFEPTFQALRAIPSLAWVPVLLLWLGIDEAPKITLIAIGAFFPVHLAVVAGIRDVDRKLVELGAVYRLGPFALFRRILLPAALPQIVTGLRTGLSLAWMFMVAAELIAATRGLGFLLSDGRETGRPDLVFGAILLLALLGKLTDGAMARIESHWLGWRDAYDHTPRKGSA
ncbi:MULTISPECIES: ABC transporter permease [Burkholderia]|jgi:sulfonate transport system permease protein|uniref:ABC transporter permease n=3 Tax=Burkholderia TaxID=32008 RepID=A0A1E3FSB5_9BURK|nr:MULTISPECIES: ABC transporter permease [Burkholderia]KKL42011.1 ABC transporter permease [Burkholderia contaminans LMG 23361]MBA9829863.1 ABC transporter permease [Burkholderia contaminans]MBA9837137.1 ABC transporter permease [Burkholderia contaminans]MBA9861767.1 ABC transporter permease [Burkholderia contaminans]MBA9904919.1 ABC transporter permease [Burkholderia contaminans]